MRHASSNNIFFFSDWNVLIKAGGKGYKHLRKHLFYPSPTLCNAVTNWLPLTQIPAHVSRNLVQVVQFCLAVIAQIQSLFLIWKGQLVWLFSLNMEDPCSICGIMINRKLKTRHMNMHSDVNFSCNTWDNSFSRSDVLKKHEKTHGPTYFWCFPCDKKEERYYKMLENHENSLYCRE